MNLNVSEFGEPFLRGCLCLTDHTPQSAWEWVLTKCVCWSRGLWMPVLSWRSLFTVCLLRDGSALFSYQELIFVLQWKTDYRYVCKFTFWNPLSRLLKFYHRENSQKKKIRIRKPSFKNKCKENCCLLNVVYFRFKHLTNRRKPMV